LDVGCGTGWLGDHFDDYTGIDGSADAVAAAAAGGRTIIQCDLDQALPFPDRSFDGVVLKDVLEHVRDPVALVAEVARVLSPEARVFACSPDAQRWVWDDYTHVRPFTRKSLQLLFRDAGFDIEKAGYESVMPGTSIVSRWTSAKRRPAPLRVAAWVPVVRRNVWVLGRRQRS
jgi:SAM-dependent methyltransferase